MTDDALFGREDARSPAGAVERATAAAIDAAGLDARDKGTAAALLAVAWSMDAARAAGKFYGVAQAGPAYLAIADALGLTVKGREGDHGSDADAWLRQLTTPTVGDGP